MKNKIIPIQISFLLICCLTYSQNLNDETLCYTTTNYQNSNLDEYYSSSYQDDVSIDNLPTVTIYFEVDYDIYQHLGSNLRVGFVLGGLVNNLIKI